MQQTLKIVDVDTWSTALVLLELRVRLQLGTMFQHIMGYLSGQVLVDDFVKKLLRIARICVHGYGAKLGCPT